MTQPSGVPARESAAPVPDDRPADLCAGVVVVGGGGGGLPTALFSRWPGNEVRSTRTAAAQA